MGVPASDCGDASLGVAAETTIVQYVDGASSPNELATASIGPAQPDIAVANRTLYVAVARMGQEGIHQIPRSAIGQPISTPAWIPFPVGSLLAQLPQSIATDGMYLYYIVGQTLTRASLAAPPPAPTAVVGTTGINADRLYVDDQCLYWIEGGRTIMKRAK